MKKFLSLIILLFISNTTIYASSAQKQIEVVLAYENASNPPYTFKGENLKYPGSSIELLQTIAKRLDFKLTFKKAPWKRGLLLMETNNIDGLFHASYKKARSLLGVYPMVDNKPDTTKSIMANSYSLYIKKGSTLSWNGEKFINLNGGTINTSQGFSIVDKLRKSCDTLVLTNNLKGDLDKLKYGKIKGLVNLENRVDSLIFNNIREYKDIVKVQIPIQSKPYYLMFSKKFYTNHTKLANKIYKEIQIMKESKEYEKIISKYYSK